MTKNEILTMLYINKDLDEIVNKITSNNPLKDDLKQDLFVILSEKDDEFIKNAYDNKFLIYYCVRILKNQYHSNTSPFHKTHRKTKSVEVKNLEVKDDEYDMILDENIEQIMHIINTKLDYVDRELIKMYYKLEEYNRFDGRKRDISCDKTISSLRKVKKKLELVNTKGQKITLSIQTIATSINRSKMIIKNNIK